MVFRVKPLDDWRVGRKGQFDPPCGLSESASSRESVKPSFFVTFNIMIIHIFSEKFIEIIQVVQKI